MHGSLFDSVPQRFAAILHRPPNGVHDCARRFFYKRFGNDVSCPEGLVQSRFGAQRDRATSASSGRDTPIWYNAAYDFWSSMSWLRPHGSRPLSIVLVCGTDCERAAASCGGIRFRRSPTGARLQVRQCSVAGPTICRADRCRAASIVRGRRYSMRDLGADGAWTRSSSGLRPGRASGRGGRPAPRGAVPTPVASYGPFGAADRADPA